MPRGPWGGRGAQSIYRTHLRSPRNPKKGLPSLLTAGVWCAAVTELGASFSGATAPTAAPLLTAGSSTNVRAWAGVSTHKRHTTTHKQTPNLRTHTHTHTQHAKMHFETLYGFGSKHVVCCCAMGLLS